MNKRNGIILGLLFVILILEIIIVAPGEIGLPETIEEPAAPHVADSQAGQVMQNVRLVEAKGGDKEWELWAEKAVRLVEGADWTIDKVKVNFFGENGVMYTVTGNKGHVVVGKNDINISGDVVTRSTNGYVFKTEAVSYDSAQRMLTSKHPVTMTGPKDPEGDHLALTGIDLIANLKTNVIDIKRNVKARKKIKDDKVVLISSREARFSGKSNYARFMGNVVIDVETMRITGPEAQFNYLPGSDTVDSVLVRGGVRVTDVDKWATSDRVSVHFKDDKFVFNGAPRVVQSGDELRGDEIIFLEGGRRVQVSNAKAKVDPKTMENAENSN